MLCTCLRIVASCLHTPLCCSCSHTVASVLVAWCKTSHERILVTCYTNNIENAPRNSFFCVIVFFLFAVTSLHALATYFM